MSNPATVRLKVPRQDLDKSSFFSLTEEAVEQWITELPMANLGQTTRQLYKALSELNQVRLLPAKRLVILEQLRNPIHYVIDSLSKHFLNQTLVLPDQPKKVAELAKALHNQLAIGYTIVATHGSALGNRLGLGKSKDIITKGLHRAIVEYTLNLIQHFQLYEQVDEGTWQSLHQFYRLAQQHKILDKTIDDSRFYDCSLESNYIRALLLGCGKPNELRQQDYKSILKPLTQWTKHCVLTSEPSNVLFTVDLQSDKPPIYTELYNSGQEKSNQELIGLNTAKLSKYLNNIRNKSKNDSEFIDGSDTKISLDLIGHLIVAWGSTSKRTFMRQEADDELELSVGLSASHHFISGELSFEALVEERGAKTFSMQSENPFMKVQATQPIRPKDIWDTPFQANMDQTQVSLESIDYHIRNNEKPSKNITKRYLSRSVKRVNSSAHGYCIEWPSDTKAIIKTGEIVGIKEIDSHNWSVAAIRWISHSKTDQIRIGLELISPSAAPYGAKIIQKKGNDTEYTRVLVLPAIPSINRPVTIVTPRFPFKVGTKLILNQRAKEAQVTLTKKVNLDGHYCQFEFKRINALADNAKTKTTPSQEDTYLEDDFDSLWNNL